jgi:hypothetical protein
MVLRYDQICVHGLNVAPLPVRCEDNRPPSASGTGSSAHGGLPCHESTTLPSQNAITGPSPWARLVCDDERGVTTSPPTVAQRAKGWNRGTIALRFAALRFQRAGGTKVNGTSGDNQHTTYIYASLR